MKLTAGMGSIVNVRMSFTDPDNNDAPFDPDTVTLRMREPDKTINVFVYGTDADLVRESAGKYLYRLLLLEEGTYRWTWWGDSPTKAVTVNGSCDAVEGV